MLEKIRLRFLARTRYRGVIWLVRNFTISYVFANPYEFLRYYRIGMEDGWMGFDIAMYRATLFLMENPYLYFYLIDIRSTVTDEEMVELIINWEEI